MITEFTERGNKLGVALASRYPPPSFERTQDRLSPPQCGRSKEWDLNGAQRLNCLNVLNFQLLRFWFDCLTAGPIFKYSTESRKSEKALTHGAPLLRRFQLNDWYDERKSRGTLKPGSRRRTHDG